MFLFQCDNKWSLFTVFWACLVHAEYEVLKIWVPEDYSCNNHSLKSIVIYMVGAVQKGLWLLSNKMQHYGKGAKFL